MSGPGYVLCVWSKPEGAWAAIGVSEDRVKIEGLAERLSMFTELLVRVLVADSCDDVDVVEASFNLEPPREADFIRPPACH